MPLRPTVRGRRGRGRLSKNHSSPRSVRGWSRSSCRRQRRDGRDDGAGAQARRCAGDTGSQPRNLHRQGLHAGRFQSRAGNEAGDASQIHAGAPGPGHGGAGAAPFPRRGAASVGAIGAARCSCAMTAEAERLLEGGRLAEAEGNVREALVCYQAAVTLAADKVLPRLRLGTLWHRTRDFARARQVLDEASRIDPDHPDVTFRLGLTCDAVGDRERAKAAFTRTMLLAPSSWQTWYLIGRDHRLLGHAEVARLAYLRALNQAPEEPEILAELGTLLWEMGQRGDAYIYLEQAVKACPVDPGFALQLGLAEMQRGDLIAAHRLLAGAKHLDPSDRRIDVALQGLALRKRESRSRQRRRAA